MIATVLCVVMLVAAFTVAGQTGASPGVDVDGPYGGHDTYECTTITFTATVDDPAMIFFRWDFDNDSLFDTGWIISLGMSHVIDHHYCDDYHDIVRVEAWDGMSMPPESDTAWVDVFNAAPTVSLGGPYIGSPGIPIEFQTVGEDTPCDDLTFVWMWGDGSSEVQDYSAFHPPMIVDVRNHTYDSPGTYALVVLLLDDDGGYGLDTVNVLIRPGGVDEIDDLIDYMKGLPIPGGIRRSLTAQLLTAQKALLRGHEDSAVRILNVFIHRVQVLERVGKLTEQQAEYMVSSAQEIIEAIRGT
jgi:hypothetical protein